MVVTTPPPVPRMPSPVPRKSGRLDMATRHPGLFAAAVVLAALILLVLVWDWNWVKGPVERAVEARTGRSFEIGGDLHVSPGRVTTIRADALRLGNAAWAEDPEMATMDRLELQVNLLSLVFRRETRMPSIELVNPDLRLEWGDEGGNWDLLAPSRGGAPPRIDRLWIEDGRVRILAAAEDTDIELRLDSREARREDAAPPVAVEGAGHWRGNDFSLEGRIESLLALQETDGAYGIDLEARAGRTRAHARGRLFNPFQLRRFDLQLALEGSNLEDLYPLLGVPLPATPPYALDGRFGRDGDIWRYEDFTGTVGDSDLAGSAVVTLGGERPHLQAELVSELLDFDDLAGLVGGSPASGPDDTTNPEFEARARERAARGRVLPDTPYELDKLRAMDADVHLRAERIESPVLPLDDMDVQLRLDDGLLTLQPLNFGVAGGTIRSDVRMDARQDSISTRVDASVDGLRLDRLFPDASLVEDATGNIAGRIAVAGTGNAVADMLASANGEVVVGMGRGQISNLLMELAGIDILEALRFLLTGDRLIPIRCAFADFAVEDGVMEARALAFDTTDTLIVGEGRIDLGAESLDLELRPRPKDRSLLALRSPLVIDGSFANPGFRPDMGRLGVRGAVALTLATITPPAALLATLELGGGEDADCGGEYAR